jgi:hypothetical protein
VNAPIATRLTLFPFFEFFEIGANYANASLKSGIALGI